MNSDINKELNRIQKSLKAPKGQWNSFSNFYYRSCEDILEAVKPLLNDLTLTLSDDIVNYGDRYYVKATVTLSNGNDFITTSALAREALDKKGMDDAQITGAASSYARKYALNGLFAIDDEKDADTKDNRKTVKEIPTECEHLKTSKHQVTKEGHNKGKWFIGCDTCKKFIGFTEAPTENDLVTNENGSKSWGKTEFSEPQ